MHLKRPKLTLYRNCVTVIKDEMENKLPKKTVRLKGGGWGGACG